MHTSPMFFFCGLAAVVAWSTGVAGQDVKAGHTPPKTDEEMIANAVSAAPE